MGNLRYGKLDGKNVVPCSMEEWAPQYENIETRRLALTQITDTIRVSTVFLGLNHDFSGRGPALWFESMTFGGPTDDAQERYETWDEAIAGHARMVQRAEQEHAKLRDTIESLTAPEPKD
jgi:hypothetical protein